MNAPLDDMSMPVVRPDDQPRTPPAARKMRKGRLMIMISAALVFVLVVAIGVVAALTIYGPLRTTLENRIEQAVIAALPDDYELSIGSTRLAFNLPASIGVRFNDVLVRSRWNAATLVEASSLALTLRPRPLLDGRTDISHLIMRDAVVHLVPPREAMALPTISEIDDLKRTMMDTANALDERLADFSSGLMVRVNDGMVLQPTEAGLVRWTSARVDADLVPGETLSMTTQFARVGGSGSPDDVGAHDPLVSGLTLALVPAADPTGGRTLSMTLEKAPLPFGRLPLMFSDVPDDHSPGRTYPPLPADVTITLFEAANGVFASAEIVPLDWQLKLATDDNIPLQTPVSLVHGPGRNTIDLRANAWQVGSNRAVVEGGVRDAPRGQGSYEFELIANDGRLAPSDARVSPLAFSQRVRGVLNPRQRLMTLDEILMRTPDGVLQATGELDFSIDEPTALVFVRSEALSVAALQRVWPAPIARGARHWVLNNLAGGTVRNLVMNIAEPLRRRDPVTLETIPGATTIRLDIEGSRFDVAGRIPPVRDADGSLSVRPGRVVVALNAGTVYTPDNRTASVSDGELVITPGQGTDILASARFNLSGAADAVGELITFEPIAADRFYEFAPEDLSGSVKGAITLDWVLNDPNRENAMVWDVAMRVEGGGSSDPIEGRIINDVDGEIAVNAQRASLTVSAQIDGLPADVDMVIPFNDTIEARRDISLRLADAEREAIAPGLETLISGTTPVRLDTQGGQTRVNVDLTRATLALPWIGWNKSPGVDALASFVLDQNGATTRIGDFSLDGDGFAAQGTITVEDGLQRAAFSRVVLNRNDSISLDVTRDGPGYKIVVAGDTFDARALIRKARADMKKTGPGDATPVQVEARIGRITGFNGEVLRDASLRLRLGRSGLQSLSLTGASSSGMPVTVALEGVGAERRIRIEAMDAGEVLRFVDLYGQVRGGILESSLRGTSGGGLAGEIKLTDFRVFDEPRLERLVSERAGERSLQEAVRRDINTREVVFQTGFADVRLVDGKLDLNRAILRGPLLGMSLSGTAYDASNRMRLSGTFLPAYGLNSLFADIPIFGAILGGRDRGLIGVTFLLSGDANKPDVIVNPLSAIAPGIFRSIFEFR